MPGWTLIDTHPKYGRTFQRPLDNMEVGLVSTDHMKGTADNIHHAVLRLSNPSQDSNLFSEDNVVEAWLSTKRRHPLASAIIRVPPVKGDNGPGFGYHFVVREHDLSVLRPNEIVFGQVASHEEALKRITALWDGPCPLSDELLVRFFIFYELDLDKTNLLHVVMVRAHCMTDGTADRTFMRCFLDTLARGGEPHSDPAQIPLEERLAMLIPASDREPEHIRSLSLARRRWRLAIGAIVLQNRFKKNQGGHTLPCRITRATPTIRARPGFDYTLLTPAETSTILANCRLHKVTFGSAYTALAQVAMARVLYRRYLRGEISEEEWAYRKRQAHATIGPVNSRPYLDKAWYEKGGGGEFMASITVILCFLPFMTLGGRVPKDYREEELSNGAPPFSNLLTFKRFLYRTGLVHKQTKAFLNHSLFFEFYNAMSFFSAKRNSGISKSAEAPQTEGMAKPLAAVEMPSVIAHGGSSLGNIDLILPAEYPLPPSHPLSPFAPTPHPARAGYATPLSAIEVDATTRIILESSMTRLFPRPAELYLGAVTFRGRLNIHCFYDRNVFEEATVNEWLHEVKEAMLWYLGQTHSG